MYRGSLSSSWNRQHPYSQVFWFSGKDPGVRWGRGRRKPDEPQESPPKDLKAKPLTEGGLPGGSISETKDALNREPLPDTVSPPLAVWLWVYFSFSGIVLLTFCLG